MKTTILSVFIGLFFCFWPRLTHAYDFHPLGAHTILEAPGAAYRIKPPTGKIQLADWPTGATARQMLEFNGTLFAVVDTGSQSLVISHGGLGYQAVEAFDASTALALRVIGDRLVLRQEKAGQVFVFIASDGATFAPTSVAALSSVPTLDRLFLAGGAFGFAKQEASDVDIFSLDDQLVWQPNVRLACPAAVLGDRPTSYLHCADGQVLVPSSPTDWVSVFPEPVTNLSTSQDLVVALLPAAGANPEQVLIWRRGELQVTTIASQLSGPIQQAVVSRDRILLRTPTGWFELLWQPITPEFRLVTASTSAVVVETDQDPRLFISLGTGGWWSDQAGSWLGLTTPANSSFNHAARTPLGWLLWQTNSAGTTGGLTLFAPLANEGVFTKVNRWASTTSPVQAVSINATTSYVAVVNSSNRLNLYSTASFVDGSWTLVSLPTNITYARPIADLRALPAGSLVELTGAVRVAAGVVSSELVYVDDATGGIQVFLDSSHGSLGVAVNDLVVVDGEISTSQTKRVLVDDVHNIEQLGTTTDGAWPTVLLAQIGAYLGRVVRLEGLVDDTDPDLLLLRDGDTIVKIHTSFSTGPHVGDRIALQAVIDWSSASGATEAWATGSSFTLVEAAPTPTPSPTPTKTATAKVTAAPAKVVSAVKTSSGSAGSAAVKTVSAVTPVGATVGTTTPATANDSPATLVADANTGLPNDPIALIGIILSGIASGLLISKGSRLRAWHAPPG